MLKYIIFIMFFQLILVFANGCSFSDSAAEYNKIVTFEKGKPIAFPDFEMTYIGERKETSKFPNGNSFTFTYYDFKIKKGEREKTVSWTTGTGIIEPRDFEFNGINYTLELRHWEKEKKNLDDDELVVSRL